MNVILGLDLSIKSSGWAIVDSSSGKLIDSGIITPESYPGHSKDRYPKKTIKLIRSVVYQIFNKVVELSSFYTIDNIVVEEINPGKGGLVSNKSLSFLHGLFLDKLLDMEDKIVFIRTSEWRSKLKISAKGMQGVKDGIKLVTIAWVNKNFNLSLDMKNKGDNDEADAIGIAAAYQKNLTKSK